MFFQNPASFLVFFAAVMHFLFIKLIITLLLLQGTTAAGARGRELTRHREGSLQRRRNVQESIFCKTIMNCLLGMIFFFE